MTQMSTTLKFDRAINQIGVTQDRVSKAQMQMTEGKQILKPSDAPISRRKLPVCDQP